MFGFLRSRKEIGLDDKIKNAVMANNLEELRKLLYKNKAKKLIREAEGKVLQDCLSVALRQRHFECMEELLKAGGSTCTRFYSNAVAYAILLGEDRFLQLLLDYGANPDSGPVDCLPLHNSAWMGDLDCFRTLLLYGADPDVTQYDFYPYSAAIQSVLGVCLTRNYEVPFVKLLIQFGANMYLPDIQQILIQADNNASRLLDREKVHPRSLMSQCRIAVRRRLKQVGKLRLIDQLEIPIHLVRYLHYHNELDYPDRKLGRYYQQRLERQMNM